MNATGTEGAGVGVRRATEADLPALTAMLARAFYDDPVARWSCPEDDLRPGVLEHFYTVHSRQVMREGEIWMTAGGESAAVWAAPDQWRSGIREDLEIARSMLHPRLLRRLPLIAYGLLSIEAKHPPKPPHWYLAGLGTDPVDQGRGLGTAALAPMLEECDRQGIGAYLESSKERNIAYYSRFGFRVTEEVRLPRGPRGWLMWRDPA